MNACWGTRDAAAAPQLRASNGIVFLFIVRIVPYYRSLEIALYLPKRGVEPRWGLQLFIVTIFVYIIAMPFLRLGTYSTRLFLMERLPIVRIKMSSFPFKLFGSELKIENALGVWKRPLRLREYHLFHIFLVGRLS